MDVTLKDALARFDHARHKKLWDWQAKNPYKDKSEWPGFDELRSTGNYDVDSVLYDTDCFACASVGDAALISLEVCERCCPLAWPKGITCLSNERSLFKIFMESKFDRSVNRIVVVKLAERIRDLPLRTVDGE